MGLRFFIVYTWVLYRFEAVQGTRCTRPTVPDLNMTGHLIANLKHPDLLLLVRAYEYRVLGMRGKYGEYM